MGTSQLKRWRGQLPKDTRAHSTPNRPAPGHSKATPETPRFSQSKREENVNPRAAVELNTSSTSQDDDPSVKSALKEITSLLNTVVKRVERVETELKKQSSVSSSSDSNPPLKKIIAVPLIVRVGCYAKYAHRLFFSSVEFRVWGNTHPVDKSKSTTVPSYTASSGNSFALFTDLYHFCVLSTYQELYDCVLIGVAHCKCDL